METLKTYKFYNPETKERLAIFADLLELKSGDELEITVIPCHVNDQFSRGIANILFELVHLGDSVKGMKKFRIPVKDGKPKATFLKFCKDAFVRKFEEVIDMKISRRREFIPEKLEVVVSKMDQDNHQVKLTYFA